MNMHTTRYARYYKAASTLVQLQTRLIVLRQNKPEVAKWLSNEFQHLGPTYMKIGQFISSRKDIFGNEFSKPFEVLRNEAIPINNVEYIFEIVDKHNVRDKFSWIDAKPLAAASISQVHRARLVTGEDVVIKIRRPDVIANINDDVEFVRKLIVLTRSFISKDNYEQTIKMLDDFETLIRQETNFGAEVKNIRNFRKSLDSITKQPFRDILIPDVYSDLCFNDMIVMSFVKSNKLESYAGSKKDLAQNMMRFFVKQVVDHGIVHGDPHEGNMGVTTNGELILYDFGNIIHISSQDRQLFKELVYLLVVQNNTAAIQVLKKLGITVLDANAMTEYLKLYVDYIKTLNIDIIYNSHNPDSKLPLVLNEKIFRLIRVFSILEGVCKKLSKDFSYLDLLDEYTTMIFMDIDFIMFKASQDINTIMSSDDLVSQKKEESGSSVVGSVDNKEWVQYAKESRKDDPLKRMYLAVGGLALLNILQFIV